MSTKKRHPDVALTEKSQFYARRVRAFTCPGCNEEKYAWARVLQPDGSLLCGTCSMPRWYPPVWVSRPAKECDGCGRESFYGVNHPGNLENCPKNIKDGTAPDPTWERVSDWMCPDCRPIPEMPEGHIPCVYYCSGCDTAQPKGNFCQSDLTIEDSWKRSGGEGVEVGFLFKRIQGSLAEELDRPRLSNEKYGICQTCQDAKLTRACDYCMKPLPRNARADAKYCPDNSRCRTAAMRERRRWGSGIEPD